MSKTTMIKLYSTVVNVMISRCHCFNWLVIVYSAWLFV